MHSAISPSDLARARRLLLDEMVGVADVARELGLQDAGHLLAIVREQGWQLPELSEDRVQEQLKNGVEALNKILRP